MVDTPEVAAYRLNYQTGDSKQKIEETRNAAVRLVAANENLSVSEERVTRATRVRTDAMARELAIHDPLIRAARRYAQTQQRVNRLEQEGVGTASSRALALDLARRNYERAITANDNAAASQARFNSLIATGRNLLAAFGITLGVVGVVNFARDVVQSTADLDDQAQILGISTDALQAYRAAALEAGASQTIADTAIRRFTRSLGEAAENAKGPAAKAFSQLELTAFDLAGGPEKALPKVIRALAQIPDVTKRAAIETAIFSRSGQQIEQVLGAWQDETDALIKRMRDLGYVIDREQIQALDHAAARFEAYWLKIKVGAVEAGSAVEKFFSDLRKGSPLDEFEKSGRKVNPNPFAGVTDFSWLDELLNGSPRTMPHFFPKPPIIPGSVRVTPQQETIQDSVNITNRQLTEQERILQEIIEKLHEKNRLERISVDQATVAKTLIDAANEAQKGLDADARANIATEAQARVALGGAMSAQIESAIRLGLAQKENIRLGEEEAKRWENIVQLHKQASAASISSARQRIEDFNRTQISNVRDKIADDIPDQLRKQAEPTGREIERTVRFAEMEEDLENELRLARMTTEEREREYAVIVAKQRLGSAITQDEEERLRVLVAQTQEAYKQQETLMAIGNSLSSFIANSARRGKLVWEDLFGSMADIFSRNLQRMIDEWLQSALFTKVPGGGGLLGLAGAALGALGAGGSGSFGNDFYDVAHGGGRPGSLPRRYTSAALFENAPRAHRGYKPDLAHDEMPVIIKKRERILDEQETQQYDAMERYQARQGGWSGGGAVRVRVELGELRVRVDTSPDFDVRVNRIAKTAAEQEVQMYDRATIPHRVAELASDPRLRS